MFGFLKEWSSRKKQAAALYEIAALQARQPAFYEAMGVPDNVDGRFEMITLHVGLIVQKLNQSNKMALAQALFDVNFVTTDKALREIGVGDLSVPKHMKRMMKGFKGRVQNYTEALLAADHEALKEAVQRNVFGTIKEPNMTHVEQVANYVLALWKQLEQTDIKQLKEFNFPSFENEAEIRERKSA